MKKQLSEDQLEKRRRYTREYMRRWRSRLGESKRRALNQRGRERSRKSHLKRTYGMTVEAYDALFAAQGFRCAVCPTTDPLSKNGWVVDHCHSTGKVRSILCNGCNVSLGSARENPATLRALAAYIEKHKNNDLD